MNDDMTAMPEDVLQPQRAEKFMSTVNLKDGSSIGCHRAVISRSGRWVTLDIQKEDENDVFIMSIDIPTDEVRSHVRHVKTEGSDNE